MFASFIQLIIESGIELIFVVLGVRRTFALISTAIGVFCLLSGKTESGGIFLGIGLALLIWDSASRFTRTRPADDQTE